MNYILSINTFEQQCVVIKYKLQSSRLEDHMKTISIDLSSFTRYYFEHRYMTNIKNIYQHAGKCADQKNIKDIIYAAILSTPDGVTYHSPNVYLTSDHAIPHWKCVLRCCAECLCINITDQETTKKHEETTPSMEFH